jgi:hypothetical protein
MQLQEQQRMSCVRSAQVNEHVDTSARRAFCVLKRISKGLTLAMHSMTRLLSYQCNALVLRENAISYENFKQMTAQRVYTLDMRVK